MIPIPSANYQSTLINRSRKCNLMRMLVFLSMYYLHDKINWLIFKGTLLPICFSQILDTNGFHDLKITLLDRARMMVCILREMLFMTTGTMQMGTTVSYAILWSFPSCFCFVCDQTLLMCVHSFILLFLRLCSLPVWGIAGWLL